MAITIGLDYVNIHRVFTIILGRGLIGRSDGILVCVVLITEVRLLLRFGGILLACILVLRVRLRPLIIGI